MVEWSTRDDRKISPISGAEKWVKNEDLQSFLPRGHGGGNLRRTLDATDNPGTPDGQPEIQRVVIRDASYTSFPPDAAPEDP